MNKNRPFGVALDSAEEGGLVPVALTPHVPIPPEEFARQMREICEKHWNDADEETDHIAADSLMVEVLSSLGYGEGCDAFVRMAKWYS
jgi:hypothetical protein